MTAGRLAAGIAGTTSAGSIGVLAGALTQITTAHAVPWGIWTAMTVLFLVTSSVGACRFPALGTTGLASGKAETMEDATGLEETAQAEETPTAAAELTIILLPGTFVPPHHGQSS